MEYFAQPSYHLETLEVEYGVDRTQLGENDATWAGACLMFPIPNSIHKIGNYDITR